MDFLNLLVLEEFVGKSVAPGLFSAQLFFGPAANVHLFLDSLHIIRYGYMKSLFAKLTKKLTAYCMYFFFVLTRQEMLLFLSNNL